MLLSLIDDSSLFDRERWVDCRELGKNAESPRYVYTLDGKREEWDPRVCVFELYM